MAISDRHLDPWIILLDRKDDIEIFSNPKLLKKIHSVDKTLTAHCNGGSKQVNMKGNLTGYGWVWSCTDFIANILLLCELV